jgi:hypothetical protein
LEIGWVAFFSLVSRGLGEWGIYKVDWAFRKRRRFYGVEAIYGKEKMGICEPFYFYISDLSNLLNQADLLVSSWMKPEIGGQRINPIS